MESNQFELLKIFVVGQLRINESLAGHCRLVDVQLKKLAKSNRRMGILLSALTICMISGEVRRWKLDKNMDKLKKELHKTKWGKIKQELKSE